MPSFGHTHTGTNWAHLMNWDTHHLFPNRSGSDLVSVLGRSAEDQVGPPVCPSGPVGLCPSNDLYGKASPKVSPTWSCTTEILPHPLEMSRSLPSLFSPGVHCCLGSPPPPQQRSHQHDLWLGRGSCSIIHVANLISGSTVVFSTLLIKMLI